MTGRRRPPLLAIVLGFAVFGAIQVGFVFAVTDDLFTRVVLGGTIALFEVIGAFVFYRLLAHPPRRRPPRRGAGPGPGR